MLAWLDIALMLAGAVAIVIGVAQVSSASAWIVAGVLAVVLALGPDLTNRKR
jgi:hypothetical protein